jgi:hypothetical protein
MAKGQSIRRKLAETIMRSDNEERKLELQRLLSIDGLTF